MSVTAFNRTRREKEAQNLADAETDAVLNEEVAAGEAEYAESEDGTELSFEEELLSMDFNELRAFAMEHYDTMIPADMDYEVAIEKILDLEDAFCANMKEPIPIEDAE